MRSATTIFLVTIIALAMITGSIFYTANRHHEAEQLRDAERAEAVTARLESQCNAAHPTSPANQRHCVKESLANND